MKKIAINTILLFFLTAVASAQIVTTDLLELAGLDYTNGKEIYARKYEFKNLIFNSEVDSTFNTLTLQLRDIKSNGKYYKNTGQLAVFDLVSKEIKWSFDINYMNAGIEQYDDVLFYNVGLGSTSRIQLTTGNTLWNSKVVIFATIPNLNIGLGYKYNSFSQQFANNLTAIDLNSGATLWERKIDRSNGWDGIKNLNDTALIIKASGLHHVNIITGEGWDYDLKTGIRDYSKTVGANVAGIALGLLTGSFMVTTGHDLISNLVSNLPNDSTCMYFASKDYLSCLTQSGKVLWRTELSKETSHSNILMDSVNVYLINDGEALYNGKSHNYGKPYFAAYNKLTGAEQYLSIMDIDKNPVIRFINGEDSVDLIFKDRIVQFSKKTGLQKTKMIDPVQYGSIEFVVDRYTVYLKKDSVFQALCDYDPRAFYLKTNKGKVLKLDRYMNIESEINMADLCAVRAGNEKLSVVYHNDKALVLNEKNKAIAELNIGKRLFFYKNSLYGIDKNTITEIEMGKIFN